MKWSESGSMLLAFALGVMSGLTGLVLLRAFG